MNKNETSTGSKRNDFRSYIRDTRPLGPSAASKIFLHLAASALIACSVLGSPSNSILNGDFELGNVMFTSGFDYTPFPTQVSEGKYTVSPHVPPSYWDWAPFHDVSGSGNMLIANGGPGPTVPVWTQTISVTPGTEYLLSYHLAKISTTPLPWSDPVMELSVNGVVLHSASIHDQGVWTLQNTIWNSGSATFATVSLCDANMEWYGNDFALDEISMVPIPEPSMGVLVGVALLSLWFGRRQQ